MCARRLRFAAAAMRAERNATLLRVQAAPPLLTRLACARPGPMYEQDNEELMNK